MSLSRITYLMCLVGLIPLALSGCLADIDFDDIAPSCEDPRFDLENRDTYCSGERHSFEPISPPEEASGNIVFFDIQDDHAIIVSGAGEPLMDNPEARVYTNLDIYLVPVDDLLDLEDSDAVIHREFSIVVGDMKAPFINPLSVDLLSVDPPQVILNLLSNALIVDMESDEFTNINYDTRLPRDDFMGEETPYDSVWQQVVLTSPHDEDRQMLVVTATAGLKVLYFEREGEGFVEVLPQIPPPLRQPLSTAHACVQPCTNPDSDVCQRCASERLTVGPVPGAAFSLYADEEEDELLYIGGSGTISTIETKWLDVFARGAAQDVDLEMLAQGFSPDLFDVWSATGTTTDGQRALHIFMGIDRFEDTLAAVAIMQTEEDLLENGFFNTAAPVLYLVELDDDGLPERQLARVELESAFESAIYLGLEHIDEGMLLIKSVESPNASTIGFAGLGDTQYWIVDAQDPKQITVLESGVFDDDDAPSQLGLATFEYEGAPTGLVPSPDGLKPVRVDVEGEVVPLEE